MTGVDQLVRLQVPAKLVKGHRMVSEAAPLSFKEARGRVKVGGRGWTRPWTDAPLSGLELS